MKNGNLNKTEMKTLVKAWEILKKYQDWAEKDAARHGFEPDTDCCYVWAANAENNLSEFVIDRAVSRVYKD